jgi:hypothetical protein
MNRKISGPATIYIGDKKIECTIESLEIEQESIDFGINDDVISEYITSGWIGTRDDRIKTNLGRVAKRVSIPAEVYSNMSHSHDKMDRLGGRK